MGRLDAFVNSAAFYLLSDYGEIICGHTVVADGGDNFATR